MILVCVCVCSADDVIGLQQLCKDSDCEQCVDYMVMNLEFGECTDDYDCEDDCEDKDCEEHCEEESEILYCTDDNEITVLSYDEHGCEGDEEQEVFYLGMCMGGDEEEDEMEMYMKYTA